ncbi:MAG TPA: polyketide synthase, partial [Thermoanaerobaculia bacterium]|nr:polyketide synthase [Thermoanaerobaculia bacterium]
MSGPGAKENLASLLSALDRAERESSLKVLLLRGIEHGLAPGRAAFNEAIERKLFARLLAFPLPIIAALPRDVAGAGFLAASLCDFMVCGESARYGYSNPAAQFYPTAAEAALFAERFDPLLAQDFLYLTPVASGRDLRARGWTGAIVPDANVETRAEELALTLATKSQDALRLLKEHLGRRLTPFVEALEAVEEPLAALEIATSRQDIPSAPASLHLDMPADGVLVVRHERANASALADDLRGLFAALDGDGRYRAVVLDGEVAGETISDETISAETLQTLYEVLSASPIPVAGVLRGDASGNAWLLRLLCDVTVHNRDGAYSAHDLTRTPLAAAVFLQRFGSVLGREILLDTGARRGGELQSRVPALRIADADEVLRAAIDLAASWAKFPAGALAQWKRQSAAAIAEKVRDLTTVADDAGSVETTADPLPELTTIPLSSSVVTLTLQPGGVAVVKMEDRQARNMFSDDFIRGVTEAFALIERNPALKVVILTGYDSYFAAGGTKESLLAIQEGKAKFTDVTIFQLPLECPLPVVAAVQGHALGAGWAMGMFADFVLLSEESRYVSPYMSYGFTPGAGATRILAEKIGLDLATESLFTAQYYGGAELRERGLRLPILPRAEVLPAAMELARSIARAPRAMLMDLKRRLSAGLRRTMEETYRLELAMHEKTFVNDPETLRRIRLNFYGEIETRSAPVPATVYVQRRSLPPQSPAAGAPAVDAVSGVLSTLKTLLAAELQMREGDIDDDAQFVDLGLDSVSGVSWMRRINEKYQTSVEVTKVYSHPTLTQLAAFIKEEAEKLGTLPAAAPPSAPAPEDVPVLTRVPRRTSSTRLESRRGRKPAPAAAAAVSSRRGPEPIAVIGMAGQFPKARNLDEFWENLAAGRNCISTIPPERWDVQTWYQPGDPIPGKTNSQWLGALDEYDRFDPLFFNISPTEALSMDPQQRVFLQACWHSIEDAGYDARALSGSRCGVFVGCAAGDYHRASRQHDLSAHGFTGGAMSILAARISYYLNLQGPCISIDTACSSSLVAIANACDSLISGGSDLALAGGVYVMSGPDMHIRTAQAGMLSPDGTCYTFDQRANGFVPGEAVGVVLLKRLSEAVRDGDVIHCVIRGWGVNQDGRTNGITAPNPESQTRLEQEVYDTYGIDPEHIQLVEAHGTATKLGDPIEVEGLKQAFRKYTQKSGYCAIGSVKSNVGHCLTAAGIAGFLKLALALKERQLPPTIHFERLNEHIDLTGSPFFINSELREWKTAGGAPRQAAVSSFGFSGTNAHIVVSEYAPESAPRPVALTPMIVPLSAKTVPQLRQKAVDLLEFLRGKRPPALNDVAYTLQIGREPMDERLGVVAGSIEELAGKLDAYLAGRKVDDVHQGQAKRGRPATLAILGRDDELVAAVVEKCIAEKKLTTLAELWVNGFELDWSRLHGEPKPRRTTLPLYPFAKERYWLEPDAAETALAARPAAAVHSTMHDDPSDLEEDRYSAEEGDDLDLYDDDDGSRAETRLTPQTRADELGTVIAAPVWQSAAPHAPLEFAERHILLCDLPQLESLPFAECLALRAEEGIDLAKRYSDYAIAAFEKIRGILQRKPQGRVLLQIVAADDGEGVLLAGLTGMLRTAA